MAILLAYGCPGTSIILDTPLVFTSFLHITHAIISQIALEPSVYYDNNNIIITFLTGLTLYQTMPSSSQTLQKVGRTYNNVVHTYRGLPVCILHNLPLGKCK